MTSTSNALYIITAKKRGAKMLVLTKNGHVSHTDAKSVYRILASHIKRGWTRVVAEEYHLSGDGTYARAGTIVMTPPEKEKP